MHRLATIISTRFITHCSTHDALSLYWFAVWLGVIGSLSAIWTGSWPDERQSVRFGQKILKSQIRALKMHITVHGINTMVIASLLKSHSYNASYATFHSTAPLLMINDETFHGILLYLNRSYTILQPETIKKHFNEMTCVWARESVLQFNFPLSVGSWEWDLGLLSLPKDWRSGGSNQRSLYCKVSMDQHANRFSAAASKPVHGIWNSQNVTQCYLPF